MESLRLSLYIMGFCCFLIVVAYAATDPNDLKILLDFKNGLENAELLKWPENGDDNPCGPPSWPHVFCAGNRITQIQVQNMGLKGPLPQNFNQLIELYNLGLQRNRFNGSLPSFSGLSDLEFAFLNDNEFDSIPSDFFRGLTSLRVLALDNNPLNATTGWVIPPDLVSSAQLVNLSLIQCNLVGPVPDFLGKFLSLQALLLSYNRLTGDIPESFGQSMMQILWLNGQSGAGLSGKLDVFTKMVSLTQLWLHGNKFTGTIPENIGNLKLLKDLNLNTNELVGLIPESLANMELDNLVLNNNLFMGPIPKFMAGNVSYTSTTFCQSKPGIPCAPEVNALLDFLGGLNYPFNLASQWSGNNPCEVPWLGLSCNPQSKIFSINLPGYNLSGVLSPSLAKLDSLMEIRVAGNNISGTIPENFTTLNSLKLLDISANNFEPPLPKFADSVKILTEGNPLLVAGGNRSFLPPSESPASTPTTPPSSTTSPPSPRPDRNSNSSSSHQNDSQPKSFITRLVTLTGVASVAALVLLLISVSVYCCKRRKSSTEDCNSIVGNPRESSDSGDKAKTIVNKSSSGGIPAQTVQYPGSDVSEGTENSDVVETRSLVISAQVLRRVTENFAPENELGRGGFGTVYKGELDDGTKIAVKRMESGVISNKASNEFQSEITVLSKVRHRHLVSLLGYSIEASERLLVYEYMSQGALSRHLFHWKRLKLDPLSWTKRLVIALDVARAIEYLHSLAHQTFIHRDLKSSNILLDDDFRAKVSDFGLVKLAPDGEKSVVTKLAGTFGYLAPEYAVMGKITTKVDVFSFGVVLIELLTGLTALDEDRSEDRRYLVEWFWRIKSNKDELMAAIDPVLEANEETLESMCVIAELAKHCTAREPNHRPDMGHAVNVLAPLIEKWKPVDDASRYYSGNDNETPLPQMLEVWRQAEGKDVSYSNGNDSRGSIPLRPCGFADSFTSADGR